MIITNNYHDTTIMLKYPGDYWCRVSPHIEQMETWKTEGGDPPVSGLGNPMYTIMIN